MYLYFRSLNTVCAGLSDGSVKIFDIASGGKAITEKAYYPSKSLKTNLTNCICGIKYLDETSNNIVVGRTDGTISIYDVRTNKLEYVFQGMIKITLSF